MTDPYETLGDKSIAARPFGLERASYCASRATRLLEVALANLGTEGDDNETGAIKMARLLAANVAESTTRRLL